MSRNEHIAKVHPGLPVRQVVDSFFFFFQAEDGIRDGRVTGVQTCALPISPASRSQRLRVDSNQVALVENGLHTLLEREVYAWPPPSIDTPVNVASRLASGVLRLRPTLTRPSITTQEIPGMSPRAIASRASFASDAAGASQTTRSAGAPTVMVPVPRARRKIRALFPVASASASAGGRSPSEASSHTLLTTPMGMTPVPVGVSLATHRRASAPASRQRRKR